MLLVPARFFYQLDSEREQECEHTMEEPTPPQAATRFRLWSNVLDACAVFKGGVTGPSISDDGIILA